MTKTFLSLFLGLAVCSSGYCQISFEQSGKEWNSERECGRNRNRGPGSDYGRRSCKGNGKSWMGI